jgi:hypothetical protein
VVTTVIARKDLAALVLAGAGMLAAATVAAGGPQIMMYITVPLNGPARNHVFGLRLDKVAAPPDIREMNPTSPLNRRALLDLQLGAHSALRLDLDRKLTWDFGSQQWHQSALPATFTLRIPTAEKSSRHEAPANQHATESSVQFASARLTDLATLTASLANPFQAPVGKSLAKPLPVAP